MNPKLDCDLVRRISQALSKPVDIETLPKKDLDAIFECAEYIAQKIYNRGDSRGRSLEKITEFTFLGKITEFIIYELCTAEGLAVEINDEESTGLFNHDLKIDGKKFEVKLITDLEDRRYVSWRQPEMISNARKNWQDFDYMIVALRQGTTIYFWYLMDNQLWNPINQMVAKSNFGGVFIKTSLVSRKLAIKLQDIQHE